MQNIGADNAGDAFYRYKMPKLVAKVRDRSAASFEWLSRCSFALIVLF